MAFRPRCSCCWRQSRHYCGTRHSPYAFPWRCPVPVLPSQRQGTNMADNWPLRNYLEFGALPGAVPCARLHTRKLLWEWRLSDVVDDVELLVSELFTNAI